LLSGNITAIVQQYYEELKKKNEPIIN